MFPPSKSVLLQFSHECNEKHSSVAILLAPLLYSYFCKKGNRINLELSAANLVISNMGGFSLPVSLRAKTKQCSHALNNCVLAAQ